MKTYYRFFKAGGSYLGLTLVLLIFFLAEVSGSFTVQVELFNYALYDLFSRVAL